MQYRTAREFFEAVSEASRDVARIRRQLDAMGVRLTSPSSPSFEPHVSGGSHDGLCYGVAVMVDAQRPILARLEADYALIDAATRVLYGDGLNDGLASLMAPWVADAMYQRYVNGFTWYVVSDLMGYTADYCQQQVRIAFDLMDSLGSWRVSLGVGLAEG